MLSRSAGFITYVEIPSSPCASPNLLSTKWKANLCSSPSSSTIIVYRWATIGGHWFMMRSEGDDSLLQREESESRNSWQGQYSKIGYELIFDHTLLTLKDTYQIFNKCKKYIDCVYEPTAFDQHIILRVPDNQNYQSIQQFVNLFLHSQLGSWTLIDFRRSLLS